MRKKAFISAAMVCGECGVIMAINSDPTKSTSVHEAEYIACCNPKCNEYEVKYKIPYIELEEIDGIKGSGFVYD